MTIGPVDGLTIEKAREIAGELCFQVSQGNDPRQIRQEQAEDQAAKRDEANRQEFTLADVWPIYIDANKHPVVRPPPYRPYSIYKGRWD